MVRAGDTRTAALYVLDECCTGPELMCTTTPMTGVSVTLGAGEVAVVVADGMAKNTVASLHFGP